MVTEVNLSYLMRLVCPAQDHFHFSHTVYYIYDFCPLPDPDVGLYILVCDAEHTSFHVGLYGRIYDVPLSKINHINVQHHFYRVFYYYYAHVRTGTRLRALSCTTQPYRKYFSTKLDTCDK